MVALILEATGAACVVIGVSLMLPAAGFIAAGAFLLAFGLAAGSEA